MIVLNYNNNNNNNNNNIYLNTIHLYCSFWLYRMIPMYKDMQIFCYWHYQFCPVFKVFFCLNVIYLMNEFRKFR